jgi:hypothetical protein
MRQISLADAGTRHSRISLADDSGPSEDSRVRHAAGGGKGRSSSAFQIIQPAVMPVVAHFVNLDNPVQALDDINHFPETSIPLLFEVLVHVSQQFHGLGQGCNPLVNVHNFLLEFQRWPRTSTVPSRRRMRYVYSLRFLSFFH